MAGHLKQQEVVPVQTLPVSVGLLGDPWEYSHIQCQSPGSQGLLTALSLGFCVPITPLLPFIYPTPRSEAPSCFVVTMLPLSILFSFRSFSSLTPGKPALYSKFPL